MSYTLQDDGLYHIPIIDLGTRLRDNFGLRIAEHPHFDEVDRVHVDGSLHYNNNAIDVQDWRDDVIDGVSWQQRTENLERLLGGSAAEVFGPASGVKGHERHLHLGSEDGIFKLKPEVFKILFGGGQGGKRATFSYAGPPTTLPTVDEIGRQVDKRIEDEKNRGEAKTRAQLYSEMSKKELDDLYDTMRVEDPAKARIEGMKMHKAYFGKE